MSEVQFGGLNNNYGFYPKKEKAADKPEEAVKEAPVKNEAQTVNPEKVMNALNLMGAQNFAHVQGKPQVDPSKFLSDEQISSIENSMADFEAGVSKYADAIKAEFGDSLSEDTVLALAANAFALEA